MSGPSIHLTLPDWELFKFPPNPIPQALPPPQSEYARLRSPFSIPADIYNGALDARVPMYIGGTYVVLVTLINAYNRRNGNQPWWIAKTRAFKTFVIIHNIFLALYSGITFIAMTRAADRVWPGFDNPNGLAGVADALCKIQGPRGLGDAVTFNTTTSAYGAKNTLINLLPNGTPDPTDVGRLWNEGLAFWGWFFYLSKFYEVLDTLIIVAKGKRSATLQTYHHAGAMLCMWAGIRYMSPPIWMFVWINSAIHTMMYTYYTLSALGIRVPMIIKRTLTTMQITQFLFGATFAAAHLLVKYDIPVATAYKISHPVHSMLAAASSTVSSVAASATSVAEPAVATYGMALLKRFLLRAAGEEGVAENVKNPVTGHALVPAAEEAVQRYHEETRWRTDYTTVNCIDTTGQSFAIWLNIVYLAPLTALFVRFFVRAYTHRGRAKGAKKSSKAHKAEYSAIEAAKGTDREIDIPEKKTERGINKAINGGKKAGKDLSDEVQRDLQALKNGKLGKKVDGKASELSDKAGDAKDKASSKASDLSNKAQSKASDLGNQASDASKNAQNKASDLSNKVQNKASDLGNQASDASKNAQNKASDLNNKAQNKASDVSNKAQNKASQANDDAESYESKANHAVDDIKREAKAIKDEVEDELRGSREGLSGSDDDDYDHSDHSDDEHSDSEHHRPGTSDSKTSAPSSPSDKKKKRKNRKKNKHAKKEGVHAEEGPVVGEGRTAAVQIEGMDEESLATSAEKNKGGQ